MATPVISSFLNVVYGEGPGNMPRDHMDLDLASQTTLYSGRIFHPDANGRAVEGASGAGAPLFIAHRGVDHPDVAGLLAVSTRLTGAVLGHTGYGVISGVPMRPGIRVQTSEYVSTDVFAINSPVRCATGGGEWQLATAAGETSVLGFVAVAPAEVAGINVLDIRIVRAVVDSPVA